MEPHVRIGIDPVSAGRVAPIDDRDRRVAVLEERVRKGHPAGPSPDHEIIGFEFFVHVVLGRSPRFPRLPVERSIRGCLLADQPLICNEGSRDQCRVTTTSRYSLGTAIEPSALRLNCATNLRMSCSRADCAGGAKEANALSTGP